MLIMFSASPFPGIHPTIAFLPLIVWFCCFAVQGRPASGEDGARGDVSAGRKRAYPHAGRPGGGG